MEPLRVVLLGQMPSGKGQVRTAVVRGRVMKFPNARFKAWRADAYRQLCEQRGRRSTVGAPCAVGVLYVPGDLVRRDAAGIMDALCHLLEHCPFHAKREWPDCGHRLVADDSLLKDWAWREAPLDRERPRLELTLSDRVAA